MRQGRETREEDIDEKCTSAIADEWRREEDRDRKGIKTAREGEREREAQGEGTSFRESARTIIRSRAGSSKDPRDDISMPCLRNNFNYPRYTKKNTKSNARNSGERASPLSAPSWSSSTVALSFIDTRCTPFSPPPHRSFSFSLGRYVPTGLPAMPMDYHRLSSRTSRAFACVCVSAYVCERESGIRERGPTYRRGIN